MNEKFFLFSDSAHSRSCVISISGFSFGGGCQEVFLPISLVFIQHVENVHKGSYKKTYENKFYQHFFIQMSENIIFKLIFSRLRANTHGAIVSNRLV